ncbi:hypothetical protein PHSY_002327 [Pseudozyma hubeiensis SY62]|uniref:EF-hand domain-containing protein n=1 Tax=Pseudozyma hubeiensis (strain SY62) TaxID=1305764 RepID=R9P0U4_PSEHS|nr:hypothetical protein PHSY_002327 [Pseudozyma hubeiensis SY62]GAC94754.1 hypothetical protein PHSY_002327 [Pseudozyma hubeiensis SY62]
MSSASSLPAPSRGARILRTRLVLLGLPGFIALVLLTNAFYRRDVSSQPINDSAALASDAAQEDLRRDECWAQWFRAGTICKHPPRAWSRQDKLDLIWVWSNSSLRPHGDDASSDLLRYSWRSAQQHMQSGFGTVTLLTPDADVGAAAAAAAAESGACTNAYQDDRRAMYSGQRPCWLAPSDPVYRPPSLLHHRQVACSEGSDLSSDACSSASIVGASAAASTSMLLAAQAPQLSDVRLVTASHHIFAEPVSSADFWNPLYGLTFRISADASQVGDMASAPVAGTDDVPIFRANTLLDHRFGARSRRKLVDLPLSISKPVLLELQQIWPKELSSIQPTVDLASLHAHYTIERFREALLWSFLVAKHDIDGDGVYSAQEASALLHDLGLKDLSKPTFPPVYTPVRTTNDESTVAKNLERAGLYVRRSHQSMQSSMDGSAMYRPRVSDEEQGSALCQVHSDCVAPLLQSTSSKVRPSVSELFGHIVQQKTACGDCMLLHLVGQSGKQGLSAFLPPPDLVMPSLTTLPLTSTFKDSDFSIKPFSAGKEAKRLDVVTALLARYAHSVILIEPHITPTMANRSATALDLTYLELSSSSAVSFKQHGPPSDPHHDEDPWIWTRYVRAWLGTRFPFAMRFESPTTEL